jgi:superfamily II DNA or RNA helicase
VKLAETIRKAALPAIWSQGVKLARDHAVSLAQGAQDLQGAESVDLRVRANGFAVAPSVTLYLQELEWSCDCGGQVDPCAHVAAAIIAVSQGELAAQAQAPTSGPASTAASNRGGDAAAGDPSAQRAATGYLAYRLSVRDQRLVMRRVMVLPDGEERPLTAALSTLLAQRALGRFEPTHDDLRIERLLGSPPRELIPLEALGSVLGALAGHPHVTLDGRKEAVSAEPMSPIATLDGGPQGSFVLRIVRSPRVVDVVAKGIVRARNANDDGLALHAIIASDLTGELLDRLPLERTFAAKDSQDFFTRFLPELEKRLPVERRLKRAPKVQTQVRPRVHFAIEPELGGLTVLATIVYGDPPVARVDGDQWVPLSKAVIVRRRDAEVALTKRLRDELHLAPGRRVSYSGAEGARVVSQIRGFQEQNGERILSLEQVTLVPQLNPTTGELSFVGLAPQVQGEGDAAPTEQVVASGADVLRAWEAGLDLVPLLDGGFAPLPAAWLQKHGHLVAELYAARNNAGEPTRAALMPLGELALVLNQPAPLEAQALLPLLAAAPERAKLPSDLRAELRPYQDRGVAWLAALREAKLGGVLADDMGLGKTLQAMAAFRGRVLVVCPKSVVHNWAAEIAKFRPGAEVHVYHGHDRSLAHGDRELPKNEAVGEDRVTVTLTTYAVLRLDITELTAITWDVVVLDEAQSIKNPHSQTAHAAFSLKAHARFALSGTPIENRLEELWSLMHFANPGLLGGLSDFQRRFAYPIMQGEQGPSARLQKKLGPFLLRRTKREVVPDLPPRTESILYVELEPDERAVYDAVLMATRGEVAEQFKQGGSIMKVLESLLRLRQAACHVALVPGQSRATSTKTERIIDALGELAAAGHKALVFSQWTSFLDKLEGRLTEAGTKHVRLDGTTQNRAAVVDTFQADAGPPVFLLSLKAGGTGLNLTAADHVFIADPWWNPAAEDQAADRAHRIGQDKPVFIYRVVARDTVEERILALQEKKRALAEAALRGAQGQLGLTRDDIMDLLA